MGLEYFFTQTEHDDQVWGSDGSDWALRMRDQILRSVDRRHEMTDDPEKADIIVFWEPHQDAQSTWAPRLRAHPLVHRFPNKVFVVSVEDAPLGFLPGLYASLPPLLRHPERHRTWVYYMTQNPYVHSERDRRRVASPENLASFRGADSGDLRSRLFEMKDALARERIVVDETEWGRFAPNPNDPRLKELHLAFVDAILGAKFSLCPRGNGRGSYRLQESMALGRAPVILSDDWVPVTGPNWRQIAIFIKEKDIHDLPAILRDNESRWEEMGQEARATYDALFHPDSFATNVLDQLSSIYRNRTHDERVFISQWPQMIEAEERRSGEKCGRLREGVRG